ncbi:hypothetical protein V6N12_028835 [Hibiscus sabdariffa]|uniref:Secreted protein n=1 Tax=Hibiscus sabdariffa TaxID=183260 RepID=A0ABR2F712_9ROSI
MFTLFSLHWWCSGYMSLACLMDSAFPTSKVPVRARFCEVMGQIVSEEGSPFHISFSLHPLVRFREDFVVKVLSLQDRSISFSTGPGSCLVTSSIGLRRVPD